MRSPEPLLCVDMKTFKAGCSPLTHKIYVGTVKDGVWMNDKKDITDSAVTAVAEHLLLKEEMMEFKYEGETFVLKVEKVDKSKH